MVSFSLFFLPRPTSPCNPNFMHRHAGKRSGRPSACSCSFFLKDVSCAHSRNNSGSVWLPSEHSLQSSSVVTSVTAPDALQCAHTLSAAVFQWFSCLLRLLAFAKHFSCTVNQFALTTAQQDAAPNSVPRYIIRACMELATFLQSLGSIQCALPVHYY